jgi:hypothetical protein
MQSITKAKEHVDDVAGEEYIKRPHAAQLREASAHLTKVLESAVTTKPEEEEEKVEQQSVEGAPRVFSTQAAIAHVLAHATAEERKRLAAGLQAIDLSEKFTLLANEYRNLTGDKAEEEEGQQDAGPQQWGSGDLHQATHKGREFLKGKDVQAFCVKAGMNCKDFGEDVATVQDSPDKVRKCMTKAGFAHKFFMEDDEKTKRVDAFHANEKAGGLKATSIFTVKSKACQVYMTK